MNKCSSASDQEEDAVYSENKYSDDDIYITKAVVAATARRRKRRRAPQPMHNSRLTGSMRVEEISNDHEEIIQGLISMKSETFRALNHLLDSGYANKDSFLSPYRRETYYLLEYLRRRAGLRNSREVFNYTHSSLRNSIERTFGVWKARFKILKGINNYPMEKQVMISVACAVVHNFIRMVQVGEPFLEEYAADCVPVGGNVDVNADYVFDDGINDTGSSTSTQQHGSKTAVSLLSPDRRLSPPSGPPSTPQIILKLCSELCQDFKPDDVSLLLARCRRRRPPGCPSVACLPRPGRFLYAFPMALVSARIERCATSLSYHLVGFVISLLSFIDNVKMAVQAPAKQSPFDDYDEDDGPVIFKRKNTAPKQNQLSSELKKPSHRQDGQSGRQIADGVSLNGMNSFSQKGKLLQSSKASPVKSPLASSKASTSSTKASTLKSSLDNPRTSMPLDGRSKFSSEQNKCSAVKEEKSSIRQPIKSEGDSEDSESDDNKPLSARLKGNINQGDKGLGKPSNSSALQPERKKESPEDSDDETLSSRFQKKSNAGTPRSSKNDYDDKKPLSALNKQNGSTTMKDERRPLNTSTKRPLGEQKSDVSSVKKQKLPDSSAPMKSKPVSVKAESKEDDDDHVPISQRIKKSPAPNSKSSTPKQNVKKFASSSLKKTTKKFKKTAKFSKYSKSTKVSPSSGDGQKKWTTLSHNGVIFPPPYNPHGVRMLYHGKPVDLTPEQEEVATMFAVMKDTEYVQKQTFRENFWNDWRKLLGKKHVIQKLDACDFTPIYNWYEEEKEKKKQTSTEEKKALKEEKLKQEEKYMWAILDGVKEKVGNFRVEPPGLFRGRGEHPKSGKLKRRIRPSDVTINIGKEAPIPECPIPGERWKEVRHDNTVTWLAFWNDPINPKEFKYVFLAASSSLKGQSDKVKYEKARTLKDYIRNIRATYTKNFTSKDVTTRQIAVATYLIDKLALRAGNEKDDDEADTVGCCTLKVENVKALPDNKLEFNFLGKDSIRYENTVPVEPLVYKAIIQFQSKKKGNEDLFDLLDTSKLNAHLKEFMPGLTAKVFRTYNASITLDEMLSQETGEGDVEEKKAVYNAANKEVAIICNHQRTVSKSHEAQMSRLMEKLQELEDVLKELKIDLERARRGKPPLKDADGKKKRNLSPEALEKKMAQTNTRIEKIKRDMHNKEETKTVALGTSKINYLDPRITVAWCKRHEVPIEKIFNKSLLSKFAWAMDVEPDFRF
ncbi:hypothetical protein TIFTF001_017751 [Ficus carica]|uniref:DNA topoisomerase I n=1 Tax=Ficus carica TaxID=3494 RepID=A0AA88AR80_FICCA|nr:hypothetical protein TIFTF001_017751 [Ficus carica]